jgi:hypothetical protein
MRRSILAKVNTVRVALLLTVALLAAPAIAQQPVPAAAASSVPMPSEIEMARLVWSTMSAVGQANETGNYSVLRDLAAPGFQIANDQSKLTQIFAGLRASGVDLSVTLLATPIYRSPPRMVQPGTLQLVGTFGLRPQSVNFEMLYQWVGGKWRLFGVAVVPISTAIVPPPATAPAKR